MSELWDWFGLSYASWLTLPRVLMHEMPEEWQNQMAQLLREYEDEFPSHKQPNIGTRVQITQGGKLAKTPDWLINYRRPQYKYIDALRRDDT